MRYNLKNLRKIFGRISVEDLSISKVLDCQLAILLKNRQIHRLFSKVCTLSRKTISRNTSKGLLLVFSQYYFNTELNNKIDTSIVSMVSISFLLTHILDSLQNATKTNYYLSILNELFS